MSSLYLNTQVFVNAQNIHYNTISSTLRAWDSDEQNHL
jgi:hypothetical protein